MAKSKEEPKYVHAPLRIFNSYQTNPTEAIVKFLDVGVCIYALQIEYQPREVLIQLIYHYYHDTQSLTEELSTFVDNLFELAGVNPDYDYKGFAGGESFKIDGIDDLKDAFDDADDELVNAAIMFYRFKQTKKLLGLTFNNGKIEHAYTSFMLSNSSFERNHGKDAHVSLDVNMLLDYINTEKTSFEFDLLAGYVAIKSIQGKKDFAATNKAFIAQRMLGCKSKSVLLEALKNKENKKFYDRITGRYQMDKLLNELWMKNFIRCKLPYHRTLYISTQLDDKLLPAAVAQVIDNKKKNIKSKENEAKANLKRLLSID